MDVAGGGHRCELESGWPAILVTVIEDPGDESVDLHDGPAAAKGTSVRPGEPALPNEFVRAEVEALLRADGTRIGEIFRLLEAGHDAEAIRVQFGLQHSSFVWSYERMIKALRDGDLPTARTVAQSVARKFRSILRSAPLSDDARLVLQANLLVLEHRATDEVGREEETAAARTATVLAEAEAISGIYVYGLPHYIRYPYDEDSGRTLLKVGRSDRDVIQRFRSQTRITALPEEPVLLRVFPISSEASSVDVERTFHRLLEAADHDRSRARTGGTSGSSRVSDSWTRLQACSTSRAARLSTLQPSTSPRSTEGGRLETALARTVDRPTPSHGQLGSTS